MKAELLPLEGKYYGTKILITDHQGHEHEISVWDDYEFIPSERELDQCTLEEWKNNTWLPNATHPNEPGKKGFHARETYEIYDTHFESQQTYELALEIVKRLNDEC